MPATGMYGKRGRLRTENVNVGTRLIAPTYGLSRIRTYGEKSSDILIESPSERLVAHMLSIDPRVIRFRPQPFTVDLNGQRLLTSKEQVKEVLARYSYEKGLHVYTPDYCIDWVGSKQVALEVKTDAYPGDDRYQERLRKAGVVLAAHGYEFLKIVLPRYFSGPLKQNIQLLQQAHRAQSYSLGPCTLEQLQHHLDDSKLTLGTACQHLGLPLNFAPILALQGVIAFDLQKHPFHAQTPVTWAHGDLTHLQILMEAA